MSGNPRLCRLDPMPGSPSLADCRQSSSSAWLCCRSRAPFSLLLNLSNNRSLSKRWPKAGRSRSSTQAASRRRRMRPPKLRSPRGGSARRMLPGISRLPDQRPSSRRPHRCRPAPSSPPGAHEGQGARAVRQGSIPKSRERRWRKPAASWLRLAGTGRGHREQDEYCGRDRARVADPSSPLLFTL